MTSLAVTNLETLKYLEVRMGGCRVGMLAASPHDGSLLFEYDAQWLASGFSISPYSLPLRPGVFSPPRDAPEGMFGIFRDSLPDDWGRLLQDRRLAERGIRPGSLSPLARLSLVGDGGLGALEYTPVSEVVETPVPGDLDELSAACQLLLDERGSDSLDALYALGSSSGGARPKVMVELDGEPWIIKFPTREDGLEAGAHEYAYAQAALACGIEVPEVKLLPSKRCGGYFAIKRFDRRRSDCDGLRKVHMASAAALLELSPYDVLDYRDLMRLTLGLTGDVAQTEQLFRVMCFNVFAKNCDDRAKNFSFLCENGIWQLSPAYDLTLDEGFFGEHATLVSGKAAEIGVEEISSIAAAGGISARRRRILLTEVKEVVSERLGDLIGGS